MLCPDFPHPLQRLTSGHVARLWFPAPHSLHAIRLDLSLQHWDADIRAARESISGDRGALGDLSEVLGATASDWRTLGMAAVVSVLTMPITAMWFLLIGGALVVVGLLPAVLRAGGRVGGAALVGLGLLVGPAIYLSLAAVQ